jgi:hypothetical protein
MVEPLTGELINVARRGGSVTYAEMAAALGTVERVAPMVPKVIQGRCLGRGLPDRSALVVGKASGQPGAGFFAPHAGTELQWSEERRKVRRRQWTESDIA